MIRQQNVGVFRTLSVAVLGLGLVGGLLLDEGGSSEQQTVATADAAVASTVDPVALEAEQLAKDDAQGLADELAAEAAEQASNAEDETVRIEEEAEASRAAASRSAAEASASSAAIPASCSSYSGNRAIGCAAVVDAGFSLDQMVCLDSLWTRESNWSTTASNASSGAYGIPQAVPGSKMASFGDDWQTNPATQIAWGMNYIVNRYSTPCGAWSHSESNGWY